MTGIRKQRRSSELTTAILRGAVAFALGGSIAAAQTAPAPPPAPPAAAQPGQPAPPPPAPPVRPPPPAGSVQPAAVQLSGSVLGYNYGPRGKCEGLMLKSGDKLSQVNFPPDDGASIASAAPIGDQVTISARPAIGMPDHGVYDLVSLTPGHGQPLTIAGPDDWRVQHVDAAVKSLNYGRGGEINGVVLDTGDFVHLGPDGVNTDNLTVGQKLAVDGYAQPMLTGHHLIEADFVNGMRVRTAPPPPPDRSGPGRGPRGRRGPGPEAGNGPPAPPPPPAPGDTPPPPPQP